MTDQPAPNRAAPIALWRIVEAFLRVVFSVCGTPEELAARHTLTTKARAVLLPWIGAAEMLMRQMLMVEAAQCAVVGLGGDTRGLGGDTHARPASRSLGGLARRACVSPPAPADDTCATETWRVSFKALPPSRAKPGARNPRRRGAPRRFHSARPLAARLEALLRAFNTPLPYAQRLARRLRQAPALKRRLMPTRAPTQIARQDYYAVCDAADAAWLAHDSS
ncbi:MAG: hypothetical protein AB7O98_05765 [Hyphomonadaceae bacterium]